MRTERAKNEDGLSRGHTFDTIAFGLELREHNRHGCKKSGRRSVHVDQWDGSETSAVESFRRVILRRFEFEKCVLPVTH